jgi:hypothetical protein
MSDQTSFMPYDSYWFKKNNDVHQALFAYIKNLDQRQGYKQQDNLRNMRLYGNHEFAGINAYNYMRTEQSYNVQNRVTLNIVQSMVDTVTSKIGENSPRPYFLTDDGNFTLKRRAEKLSKFAEGCFYSTDYYTLANQAFQDSCIFGTGAVKIYREGDEIKAERVFIDELMLDDSESYYSLPRQMHQRKWIHKDVLKEMFPGSKGAIDAAANDSGRQDEYKDRLGDMLLVIESWHLPSGKKAKDGRHVICINNETLYDGDWTKDYFPFVFYRWNLKPLGFWGQGIAEQLTGLQLEINKLLRTIQVSMHLVSVPKIFLEASSKVVTAHLNNKIGGIIRYAGTAPTEGKLGTIPAELFSHVDRLYSRAFEIIGISQMSAQSQKPAGLDSGKALRTYNEIESERFKAVAKRFEKTFLDAAKIMIDIAKDIADDTGNFSVKTPGSSFLQTIKWEDVDMDEDQYIMQVFPASALSKTPAARLQEVQELMQAGMVSKEDGMKLLNFPDLTSYYNMANAGAEDVERQIEIMMDQGEYETPEPFQNLQYGIVKMQQAYLLYRSQKAPEERLELLRRWISDAKNLLDGAKQEAANSVAQAQANATPVAGAPAQTGVPAAPPTSDMQALPTAGAPVA